MRLHQTPRMTGLAALPLVLLVALALAGSAQENEPPRLPGYERSTFGFDPGLVHVVAADLDGDGHDDLIGVAGGRFSVLMQDPAAGFGGSATRLDLAVPGRSVAWCVAPLAAGERPSICAWLEGGIVKSWRLVGGDREPLRFASPREECRGLALSPPRGFRPLTFVRDINADGRPDLVLPGAGAIHLYLRQDDGSFAASASVSIEATRNIQLGSEDLTATVGQSLSVPMFTLRDVNGDDRPDLVSESDARFEVFLQRADGSFPRRSSYGIDLEVKNQQQEGEYHENMDTSNLLKGALPTHQVLSRDIDGDGREDLLVRRGQKISLYRGTEAGVDETKPLQILRASGNVVTAQLVDEDDDGLQDLLVIRMEKVSLSDLFLWLMLPGTMDIAVLVYRNEDGQFVKKPSRTIQIHLKFPSIISLIRTIDEMVDDDDGSELIVEHGDLDGDSGRDTVVLRKASLQGFLGEQGTSNAMVGGEAFGEQLVTLHYSRDVDDYTVDFEELFDTGAPFRPRVPDTRPDLALPCGEDRPPEARPLLVLHDFNGDDRDDVLVLYRLPDGAVKGSLYRSRR